MNHLRVLNPADGILGFYDGRVDGYKFAEGANWVDEGALSVGICSYAIVDGDRALVYDTHVSIQHAEFVRRELEERGVSDFVVVLSHWHLDHVAGTAAFPGAEVIANERTTEQLAQHRPAIEAGTLEGFGPPAIEPLVMPSRVFSGSERLDLGRFPVELIHVNIHSDDETVLWLPEQRLLFAGDTMEDTVTFVTEPEGLEAHLADLDRLWELGPERILPNHGSPEVIESGGYPRELIRATQRYVELLRRIPGEPELAEPGLRELLAESLEAGWINHYEPYEEVHRENIEAVRGAG